MFIRLVGLRVRLELTPQAQTLNPRSLGFRVSGLATLNSLKPRPLNPKLSSPKLCHIVPLKPKA